ncbi:MAG: 4Fe-4S binding protein [Calditrichaeota bacterium]|nr:4Fe-4S binding protein [Calditrichota bacterium]
MTSRETVQVNHPRQTIVPVSELQKPRRKVQKASEPSVQPYRRWVQWGFFLLVIWIGIEFFIFVTQLQQGKTPAVDRPPGVEAFLPLSALISLKYWILTGVLNKIHPASVVLLLFILGISLVLKRSFCSWICPIGFVSEWLFNLHKKLFDRPRFLPRWLDYPLRSLKYLLLLFFLKGILVDMNLAALKAFIYSPYNRVADIKMLLFFTNMSETTFWTLVILVLLSILTPHFWCRFLCPYGALLGVISWLSPFKIHRNTATCVDCGKCSRVCPANIQVQRHRVVLSDECHTCLQCVDACPVKDALSVSVTTKKFHLNKKLYPVIIIITFLLFTGVARITGYWQNAISLEEYQYHIQHLHEPEYGH